LLSTHTLLTRTYEKRIKNLDYHRSLFAVELNLKNYVIIASLSGYP